LALVDSGADSVDCLQVFRRIAPVKRIVRLTNAVIVAHAVSALTCTGTLSCLRLREELGKREFSLLDGNLG
jgi:hypothetical protein